MCLPQPGINSQGAWDSGAATKDIKPNSRGTLSAVGDDNIDKEWLDWIKAIDYLVVQASYQSPITEMRTLSCRPVSG